MKIRPTNFQTPSFGKWQAMLFITLLVLQHTQSGWASNATYIASSTDEHVIVVKNNELVFETKLVKPSAKFTIATTPEKGTVKLNADHSISYIPAPDICGEEDFFSYILQTGEETDTVAVHVEILCENLTIYSGFSPNGDGINDTFTIKGIENFPDNSLSIFDFTGEEIYFKKGYNNEWDGSTALVPLSGDYTYYYVFSDGTGNYYSGYFKINLD